MEIKDARIIINEEIKIITPDMLAELFACMDSSQQAEFFNHVAEVSSKWHNCFEMQLQYITDEDGLTLGGRRVMQGIGEYSHWGLVPKAYTEI